MTLANVGDEWGKYMSISFRLLARHMRNPTPTLLSLRDDFGQESNITLKFKDAPFSVMTQNMALVVAPVSYKGTDREGAIKELISRIKADPPDVVGLCEVFANEEREKIRHSLSDIYGHHLEGPDEEDLESDGGLLLLSKHPVVPGTPAQIIYRECAGPDCLANKGVLYMKVRHSSSMMYDVFFSHMQDIEALSTTSGGPKNALYSQLTQFGQFIQSKSDPTCPAFILGDLNIPGENITHYKELLRRLGMPVDLWIAQGNTPASGFTNTTDNNFYAESDDASTMNHRLDFILMKAGSRFIPVSQNVEVLKWTRAGRQISDHFGLLARFEQMVQVDF
jgi:hypothetical protein